MLTIQEEIAVVHKLIEQLRELDLSCRFAIIAEYGNLAIEPREHMKQVARLSRDKDQCIGNAPLCVGGGLLLPVSFGYM